MFALLVVEGANLNAEVRTDWEPENAFATTWTAATHTLSWGKNWANVLYTGFAPKTIDNTTEVDLSKYTKIHYEITSLTGTASDENGAYIDLKVRSTGKDNLTIKLREGAHDIVFADYATTIDFSKFLEATISATYAEGAADGDPGSAIITEMYLYTDRWEIQQQTVNVKSLGTALSLSSVVSGNTLVSIAAGSGILYGTHKDNQIYWASLNDAVSAVENRGANESTYRFKISEATDGDLVYPDGITTLYRIKAFKGDGTVVYTGPWSGDGYLNDIGWTYNIAKSDDGCYYAITAVAGKTNTYKISSYKKDGTKRHDNIYDKSEWIFNVITETPEDIDAWVEVQGADTEDPGVAAVPEGWISLITNGKLDDADVTSFWTKNEDGGAIAAVISATGGRMGGRGIEVVTKDNAANEWGTQFFIKSSERLKEGQKLHVEFDYRAEIPVHAATQVHRAPGDYNANIDDVNFTVNWKHYSKEFTIAANQCKQDGNPGEGDYYLQSFCLNLSENRSTHKFYFDNIVMWTEDDPLKPQKVALQNAITKGNAQSSYVKTTESFGTLTSAIEAGEAALVDAAATATSLTNAATAITDAIAGLKLIDGYTNLTKAMYVSWNSATEPTTITNNNPGCDYVLFSSTGQPYGNGAVPLMSFADLSAFDRFEILSTGGTPRILLNRDVNEGQWSETESESHLIDNTKGNSESWHAKYYSKEGNKTAVDLKQLVTDKGFAHLHTIKTVGGNVTVSDMLLYKAPLTSSANLQGYKTFYATNSNFKVDEKTTIYKVTATSTTSVTLEAVEGKIVPKNTPVILKTTATDYKITLNYTTEDSEADFDGNLLKVANATISNVYILAYITDGGLGFYKYTDELSKGQVYVDVASSEANVRLSIDSDEEETAISDVITENAEDGVTYNLAGQPVGPDYKGVVIKNGKKFLQ